ncbi:MAG TPA: (4Fe-4S)-binding protein [Jiangellaceae bacterium]|nr:(4Fe-4S)-binding protein [Jiangellaceae bacterium]
MAEGITVEWDPTLCIHAGICSGRLPQVFDSGRRPWVDPAAAGAAAIAEVIQACPTGALRYRPRAEVAPEEPDEPTTVEVQPDGPLYVRGRIRLRLAGGRDVVETPRAALCRCGASTNKPFCDNSHRRIGFRG